MTHNINTLFKMGIWIVALTQAQGATVYFKKDNTNYRVNMLDATDGFRSLSISPGVCGTEAVEHAVPYGYDLLRSWSDPVPFKQRNSPNAAEFYRGAGDPYNSVEECLKAFIQGQVNIRSDSYWKAPNLFTLAGGILGLFLLGGFCLCMTECLGRVSANLDMGNRIKNSYIATRIKNMPCFAESHEKERREESQEANTDYVVNISNIKEAHDDEEKSDIHYDTINRLFPSPAAIENSEALQTEINMKLKK